MLCHMAHGVSESLEASLAQMRMRPRIHCTTPAIRWTNGKLISAFMAVEFGKEMRLDYCI